MSNPRKRTIQRILLITMLLAPIIGWILPADFLDYSSLATCPSKALFDIECFGCGISRAVMHLHNLDLGGAIYYNQLVVFVYPFLIYIWFKWTRSLYKKVMTHK